MASTEYYYMRKSGQIPVFGDWEGTNEMPITQYFDCARQAGLLSCNRECCNNNNDGASSYVKYNVNPAAAYTYSNGVADVYGFGFYEYQKPATVTHRAYYAVPPRKTRTGINKSCSHVKEQRKHIKVRYSMDQPRNHHHHKQQQTLSGQKQYHTKENIDVVPNKVISQQPKIIVKPVDEDLYKIPSELADISKRRKKVLGFLTRCMAPPCSA